MDSGTVILLSMLIFSIFVRIIFAASKIKALAPYEEFRIVVIGASTFMYVSWLVIYMANIHPFIEPVFSKHQT